MKVCKTCGSSDVHIMAWIGINDGNWKGDIEVKDNVWCEKCKKHVQIKRVSYKHKYDPSKK